MNGSKASNISDQANNYFCYRGEIPASKSMMNRALIGQLYEPSLTIQGSSSCDDVKKMAAGIKSLHANRSMDCGSAGTVFRFLTMAAARKPGRHVLLGSERLLSRPQETLKNILAQLEISVEVSKEGFVLEGDGWQVPNEAVIVDRSQSSQFATGLLINAWDLAKPLRLEWQGEVVSEGYWLMSLEMMKKFGMTWDEDSHGMTIPPHQRLDKELVYRVESDLSSSFAVAALAALLGEATFENYPFESVQPDQVFVGFLKEMGAEISFDSKTLSIKKATQLKPIAANLLNCPDLFPVLGVLAAFAQGTSRLFGAPHLVHKESNRIAKTAELIKSVGRKFELKDDGMIIHGRAIVASDKSNGNSSRDQSMFSFDPDQDHRLAFAASLIRESLGSLVIEDHSVVNKSFPEFWSIFN